MLATWHMTILDEPARLLRPEHLAVSAMVLLLGAAVSWATWRRLRLARALVPPRLLERAMPGFSTTLPMLRLGATVAGALLLALSLSQPGCGVGKETVRRAGVDLVVVLDASRSMLARDIRPSRFEMAKIELTALLDELSGDRFGLVAFAGAPIVQVPLTTDHRAAAMYLRAVHPDHMPRQGTNIGAALRTAHRMLEESPGARSRVVLLISDGEDHHGDARDAAMMLAGEGARIFTIGIGTPDGELVPVGEGQGGGGLDIHRGRDGEPVLSRLDEDLMEDIARIGGGAYVNTGGHGIGVTRVTHEIRGMEQEEREVMEIVRYADRSVWLLVPGFILVLAGAVIPSGRRRGGLGAAAALALLIGLGAPSDAEARRLLESEHPTVERGNEAFAEGRYDDALVDYDEALNDELDPGQRAVIHFNRGTALAALGDTSAARQAFEASTALGDRASGARDYYNLGTSLLQTGDAEGAIEALAESLRRDGTNTAAKHNLELALRMRSQSPPDPAGPPQPETGEADPDEHGDDGDPDESEPRDQDEGDGEGSGDEDDGDSRDGEDAPREAEGEPERQSGEDPEPGADSPEAGDAEEASDDGSDDDTGAELSGDPDEGEAAGDLEDRRVDGEVDDSDPTGEGAELDERRGRAGQETSRIDEQDVDALLDALQARERPLQPHLFRPPAELGRPTPEERDW